MTKAKNQTHFTRTLQTYTVSKSNLAVSDRNGGYWRTQPRGPNGRFASPSSKSPQMSKTQSIGSSTMLRPNLGRPKIKKVSSGKSRLHSPSTASKTQAHSADKTEKAETVLLFEQDSSADDCEILSFSLSLNQNEPHETSTRLPDTNAPSSSELQSDDISHLPSQKNPTRKV